MIKREELIQSIVESLARSQRVGQPAIWETYGLSRAQAGLLFMIAYHQNIHVKKIAEFLGVSKSAASQLVDPLVNKKLVIRQADSNDRRISRLIITPEGMRLIKKLERLKFAGLRSALAGLSDAELKLMADLHTKLDLKLASNKE